MTRLMRCETCNTETIWPIKFCSKECEKDFWDAMGYPEDDFLDDVSPIKDIEERMSLDDLDEMNELNNKLDRLSLYDDQNYYSQIKGRG